MTLESIEPDKRQLGLEAITKYLDNQIIHPSHYCAEGLRELALSVELGKLLTRHSGGGWEVRIDPLQDCVANARRSCALADWTLRRLPRIARSIGATLPEFAWEYIDEALERPPCGVGKSTIGKEFRDWFICHLITIVQQATDLPLLPYILATPLPSFAAGRTFPIGLGKCVWIHLLRR